MGSQLELGDHDYRSYLAHFLFTYFPDEKFLAIVAGNKLRIISWENGKEVLKFPDVLVNSISYLSYGYLSFRPKASQILLSFLDRKMYIMFLYPVMPKLWLHRILRVNIFKFGGVI